MDDVRFEWIRDRVYKGLEIKDDIGEVFEELINRDDGECERILAKFLNETPDEDHLAIKFYKKEVEEEEEVEVECDPSIPDIEAEQEEKIGNGSRTGSRAESGSAIEGSKGSPEGRESDKSEKEPAENAEQEGGEKPAGEEEDEEPKPIKTVNNIY